MIDIILTTHNRLPFLKETIAKVQEYTHAPYRLFIGDDCSDKETYEYLQALRLENGTVFHFKQRMGLVHSFNLLWAMVDYWDHFIEQYPYLCYLQDDACPTTDNWITTLISAYEDLKENHEIGFFSGYDAPEHPHERDIKWNGRDVILKPSISFQNAVAEKSFWDSIGKIPRLNPDGSARGFPAQGKGSQIDLYMTGCMSQGKFVSWASADNSSYKQGKKILVLPGLIDHLGIDPKDSNWRDGYR